jgi:hypothetical protein
MTSSIPHTPPVDWSGVHVEPSGVLVVALAEADVSGEDIDALKDGLGDRLGVQVVVIAGAAGVTFVPGPADIEFRPAVDSSAPAHAPAGLDDRDRA